MESRWPRLWGWVLAVAALVRLWELGGPPLSTDETGSVFFGRIPPSQLTEYMLAVGEVHPPGFYGFIHLWQKLGHSELLLRLPSVLFGLGSLAFSYALFRAWAGPRTATLAGLALALSTYHIEASRELRMYAVLALVTTAAFYLLQRWLDGGHSGWLAGYAAVTGASFYLHYLSFFALPVAGCWVLLEAWKATQKSVVDGPPRLAVSRLLGGWCAALVGAGLPFLPWVPTLLRQTGGQDLMIRPAPAPADFVELFGRMAGGNLGPVGSYPLLSAGVAVLVAIAFASWTGRDQIGVQRATLWLVVPVLVLGGLSTFTGLRLFEFKYFIWCSPALAFLLVRALLVAPRPLAAGLAGGLVLLNFWSYYHIVLDGHRYGADWPAVVRELQARAGPNDPILVHPSMNAVPLLIYGMPSNRIVGVDEPTEEQLRGWGQASRLWLVTTPNHPYVAQRGLASRLGGLIPERERRTTAPYLPSGAVSVILFAR